jgi:DNA-binding transcriptional MerR regulator
MEKPVLKIGELAARSGLTVRALHHYDSIGLLTPSARADSGYRLYNRADVARLHQIQALRKFGMSLADIATFLASSDAPFADIVAQQIVALGKQIEQASALRERLSHLQRQMAGGDDPELEDWLSTLEQMDLFDKYFSRDELRRLPFWQQDARRNAAWAAMVSEAETLLAQGTPAASPQARALAQRWMLKLEAETAANPEFARRITTMLEQEPAEQQRTRITPALRNYIGAAFSEHKMALYANYLNPEEICRMRAYNGEHQQQWLMLISAVYQQMEAGIAATTPQAQALAREWMTLYYARVGDHPDTQARLRLAHQQEPELLAGTWISPAMLNYVRQAYAACGPA